MTGAPTRSFTLHLIKNCPEAEEALRQWQEGDLTFEEAMMEVVKRLVLTKEQLQHRLNYALSPPRDAAGRCY